MKFIKTDISSVHVYLEEEYKVLHLNLLRFTVQYMSSSINIILGNICIETHSYYFNIQCLINPFEENSIDYTSLCKDNAEFFKRTFIAIVNGKTLPDEEESYIEEFAKSIDYFPRYSMHTITFSPEEILLMKFFEIEYDSENGICNIKINDENSFRKISFAKQILSETDFKTLITLIVSRTKNISINDCLSEINVFM